MTKRTRKEGGSVRTQPDEAVDLMEEGTMYHWTDCAAL